MTEHIIETEISNGALFIPYQSKLSEAVREEIVRCRDCRHYDRPNARCMKFGIDCYLADPQVSDLPGREYTFGDYGFCAWAVKRKEGGDDQRD